MPKKPSTTEEFVAKAKTVHGNRYDYSRVRYLNSHTDVELICLIHDIKFFQRPNNHIQGRTGCIKCDRDKFYKSRALTTQEFIGQAKRVHGSTYDYSLVEYVDWKSKVKIICKKHGMFEQAALGHKQGQGCPRCKSEKTSLRCRSTKEEFIDRAMKIHKSKYSYDQVIYINNSTKVKINCPIHGIFEQVPASHLIGSGCPECGDINTHLKQRLTQNEFIDKARKIHGDHYDYTDSNYINHIEKIRIRCKKHNHIFYQKPNNHLNGQGCPLCCLSQGEEKIRKYLEDNKIQYEPQKTFNSCKHRRLLPFDFFVPLLNTLIEFDGGHHFTPIGFGSRSKESAEIRFKETLLRDHIKTEFCRGNNINLIRIPYFEINNIENILGVYFS
jgi:hypothetical protein